jgi:hypothetical protein
MKYKQLKVQLMLGFTRIYVHCLNTLFMFGTYLFRSKMKI